MTEEALKKSLGNDYPTALVVKGVRMPLVIESRFTRYYNSGEPNTGGHTISRFMDGSASITSAELQRDWVTWTNDERIDFCQASVWLHQQPDFPTMLRFIMQHGTSDHWSSIAISVASQLPNDEAFSLLRDALHATSIGRCSNIIQAIATTKHAEAERTLRHQLQALWRHADIWNDDGFTNSVALDATTSISHLIELGASPSDFEDQVRKLSQHVCPGNRNSCRTFLSKYYPSLITEN